MRRQRSGPRMVPRRALLCLATVVGTALVAVAATRAGPREGARDGELTVKLAVKSGRHDFESADGSTDGSGSLYGEEELDLWSSFSSSGSESGSGSAGHDEIVFPYESSASFSSSSSSSSSHSNVEVGDEAGYAGSQSMDGYQPPKSWSGPFHGSSSKHGHGADDIRPPEKEDRDLPDDDNKPAPTPAMTSPIRASSATAAPASARTPAPQTTKPVFSDRNPVLEERAQLDAPAPTPVVTQKPATSSSGTLKPSSSTPTPTQTVSDAFAAACTTGAAGCVTVVSSDVKTLSIVASDTSFDGSSSSGSAHEESVIIIVDKKVSTQNSDASTVVTPYQSNFCRCKVTECQNEYPGNSTTLRPMCEASTAGTCRAGYKMCLSTTSYKLQVTPTTPNSVADITFTLLASDIMGAFHNLGDQSPITRASKWWVAISLPTSWRFVTWEMTSVEATLTGQLSKTDISRAYQVRPCNAVTDASNCPDQNSTQVGFINVMELLQDRQDLMKLVSKAPILFKLTRSVITGPDGSSSSSSVGIILAYEKISGALGSAFSTSGRKMRELSVNADLTTELVALSGTNLGALSLAAMDVPAIEDGTVHSSLVWVDGDSNTLTLSFSTSTVIGLGSVDPKVCVNLRSSRCGRKGRPTTSNVTFEDLASAAYMKDGNPFINLYSSPGDVRLEIDSANETYFCVKKLLPSGAGANKSWEINTDFTFQLQVAGVMWAKGKEANTTARFRLPQLAEISLIDRERLQGSDCAQLLSHESTYSSHGLSIYSVMSVTIYSVALVGAILITRMNGVTFSAATFFNDMTSVCVVLVFLISIVGNAIWIHVSSNGQETNSSHIYYLLRQITMCCTWTMMTSVCFHWLSVLNQSVRKLRRVYVLLAFMLINGGFYTYGLYGMISLTDFFKCTYNDYLKNPRYNHRLCDSDYCPDLQPYQWKYATQEVCKYVHDSSWYFAAVFGGELMIFFTAIVLLVLGTYVIQRGTRLIQQSGDVFDEKIVSVMRKSLRTYLAVILAISCSLGVSSILNLVLYTQNWKINAVVWYTFTIWLPTLIPPAGFLVLQWNPRLHGMNWNPSLHVKDRSATKDNLGDKNPMFNDDLVSDTWTGASNFFDSEYVPIGADSIEGNQNILALSVQLVSKVPIAHACFIELYVTELSENDVTGEDVFEDLPSAVRHRSSISSLLQTGLQQESMKYRRGQSLSMRASMIGMNSSQWVRVGFTETVLPTLVQSSSTDGSMMTQVATFLSVLQIPVMPTNPVLRFVVYELPDGIVGAQSMDRYSEDGPSLMRSSSMQLDERARHARVSGMGLSPPTRPQVFCEFTCSSSEVLASDEMNLIAREGSHRRYMANNMPESLSAPEDAPNLRIKSMTVSTRTLKENNGFYVTKSFQFAEGNEMVVEDMTESVFTNEIPRQYLELLRVERTEDLNRAKTELTSFETKCRTGLMSGLYDNLIDQIQDENDQTVVLKWLEERVQRRRLYVDALRDCHQVCINRAEEGVNYKASTEKKSALLRFLPINLHVQDMWVGPTADLRSQRSRRTASTVKVYPTITVGAFAAHCFKFRHGGSILSLRSKLQKRTLSRLQSDVSDRGGSGGIDTEQEDWTKADLRSQDEILWQLTTRLDMCVSQALTALVTSFCRNLEKSLQHPIDRHFLQLIDSIGFLFQVESLLSTQGKEIGMLEDFSASVDAMKNMTFVLDTSPPSHLPSTLNLHLRNTNLPSVVSVRINKGAKTGAFIIVVGIRCQEDVLATLPASLRSGRTIPVTPVLFTQGINEMQTLANNASGKKTYLQDTINQKSFRVLTAYIEEYKKLATVRPDAVPTPVSTITPLLASLEDRIIAARKQVVKTKHPKIIQESSRLCRLLGAGRVTSCKSAKDRTGMSVTLEQIQLLCDHHGLPQEFVIRTVSTMRSNGVRLENAFKNTGKRQYAFNALQRSLLPEEYKCPEGTYGRGQVS